MQKIKTITLIRHGKPDFKNKYSVFSLLRGFQVQHFIDDYNEFEVPRIGRKNHCNILKNICNTGDLFMCSKLRRTSDSFRLLGVNNFKESELLSEAELPSGFLLNLILPLPLWVMLLRLFWFFGINSNCESFMDFRKRIKLAAKTIESITNEKNNIVIMAHGFFNRSLRRELCRNSWKQVKSEGGISYWSYQQFRKKTTDH